MENCNRIPRVIHYCWFGGNPLPESALRCIESWRRYCPGYEIRRWDEGNYSLEGCRYAQQAYQAKKWAFVSDYARFDILHRHGGVYFDTDVELIRPIEDILEAGPFFGVEQNLKDRVLVAPGLGAAVYPGHPVYAAMVEQYQRMDYLLPDGSENQTTVVAHTTRLLESLGLTDGQQIQQVAGIRIYPWMYFCPMMFETGELTVTEHTRSIHHYTASWLTREQLHFMKASASAKRIFGLKWGSRLGNAYSLPWRVVQSVRRKGLIGTWNKAVDKIKISIGKKSE